MAKEEKEVKKEKRPTAQKRMLQNKKRRANNKARKSQIRTAVRDLETALVGADKEKTQATLNAVYSLVDKAVKSGVYKKNKASRTKARLTARAMATKV